MTKKEIYRQCDYWMLHDLNDAIDGIERGYHRSTINESMAEARQVLLMASSMKVISTEDFDAISKCLCFTSLNV